MNYIIAFWTLAFFASHSQAASNCLWRIQGKTSAIHIFGSIHFLKAEFYPLPKPVEDAYAQSKVVVLEADLDGMNKPESQLKMLQAGSCPPGETIKQHLSPETYAKLQSYLNQSVGVGSAFDSFRPWMAAVALVGMELKKLGYDPEQGVDNYFFDKAKRDKKQCIPLETMEFQIGLFTALSKEDQEAMLKETLQEIANFKGMLADIVQAWRAGDTKKLDALMLDAMRDFPGLHKKLLIDRNKQWAQKIEDLLAKGSSAFVCVGAAHLVGKDSLIDLLAARRLKMEQR